MLKGVSLPATTLAILVLALLFLGGNLALNSQAQSQAGASSNIVDRQKCSIFPALCAEAAPSPDSGGSATCSDPNFLTNRPLPVNGGQDQFFVPQPEFGNGLQMANLNDGCGARYADLFDYMYIQIRPDVVSDVINLRFYFTDGSDYAIDTGRGTLYIAGAHRPSQGWVWRGWVKTNLHSIEVLSTGDARYNLDMNPNMIVMAYAKSGSNMGITYTLGSNINGNGWASTGQSVPISSIGDYPNTGVTSIQVRADIHSDIVRFVATPGNENLDGGGGTVQTAPGYSGSRVHTLNWQWDGIVKSDEANIRLQALGGDREAREVVPNTEKQIIFFRKGQLYGKDFIVHADESFNHNGVPLNSGSNSGKWYTGNLDGWNPQKKNDYLYMFVHVRAEVTKEFHKIRFFRGGTLVLELPGGDMDFEKNGIATSAFPSHEWQATAWVPTDITQITIEMDGGCAIGSSCLTRGTNPDVPNMEVMAYAVPKPPPIPADGKYIFVTSQRYDANLGGWAGANGKCQLLAGESKIPSIRAAATSFKALLSDSATNARDRVSTTAAKLYNVLGEKVSDDWNDLWNGNIDVAVKYDENGNTFGSDISPNAVWTGSNSVGVKTLGTSPSGTPASFCASSSGDWTDNTIVQNAKIGNAEQFNGQWLQAAETGCNGQTARLYCVQQ